MPYNAPTSFNGNEIEEAKETLASTIIRSSFKTFLNLFLLLFNFLVLYEISQILNCGLDRETLSLLVSLCENGVNPEALAAVVKELRKEAATL